MCPIVIPVRILQCKCIKCGYTALEGFLNSRSTRDWKMHGAQLLAAELVVVVAFVG
jgi:hypothetical protein